ncbi:MAG: SDR family oxidoreductase [Chloroflexi bacterium]|nr:SDR family oxidoreductase [Chloroflexota bacterium]MBU1880031.1 SDR family oxidoreductase [Chloroflexota bacterium]
MENKVALVTGAALGYQAGGPSIGGAIALRLAADGAKVVVVDVEEPMGRRTADTIRERGGTALFVQTDVAKTDEVVRAVETARREFGALHYLVNCAATYEGDIARNVVDISESDWQHTIEVNLNGYFRFAKYAIPLMLQSGGGAIVNISSGAAFRVIPDFSVYSVTKAAINALTRTLAIDFSPHIRANAVCPGFVRIANSEGERTPEQVEQWIGRVARGYPLQRVCTVDEIASVALFLLSDEASYINGQCLVVDGGRSIANAHEF